MSESLIRAGVADRWLGWLLHPTWESIDKFLAELPGDARHEQWERHERISELDGMPVQARFVTAYGSIHLPCANFPVMKSQVNMIAKALDDLEFGMMHVEGRPPMKLDYHYPARINVQYQQVIDNEVRALLKGSRDTAATAIAMMLLQWLNGTAGSEGETNA